VLKLRIIFGKILSRVENLRLPTPDFRLFQRYIIALVGWGTGQLPGWTTT